MKKETTNYLAVGLFVLTMLAVLLIALFRITGQDIHGDSYYVYYTNIMGIGEGSVVTFGGYPVGNVEEVIPERSAGKTLYKLRLNIRSGWEIPSDSVARITFPSLLASVQIDIQQGKGNRVLKPGDTIPGESAINLYDSLASAVTEFHVLANDTVKPLLDLLNRQIHTLGENVRDTMPEVTGNINNLLVDLNAVVKQVSAITSDANQNQFKEILERTNKLSLNLLKLSGDFDRTQNRLDRLFTDSHGIVTKNREDIRSIVIELRNSLVTLSQHISVITYNLEMTSRNMNEFSRQIRSNPGILIGGTPPKDKAKADN